MNPEIKTIAIEIDINAPKERVWACLTKSVSDWWPKDFMGFGETSTMHFEFHAGGRLYETTPEGGELLWSQVLMITPGESLEMAGHVSPSFGGPSINYLKLALEGAETTKLRLTNTVMGTMDACGAEQVTEGWNYLYGAFKTFCEAQPRA